jgi:hypothetical protein
MANRGRDEREHRVDQAQQPKGRGAQHEARRDQQFVAQPVGQRPREVAPGVVEFEVAVPRLTPALR